MSGLRVCRPGAFLQGNGPQEHVSSPVLQKPAWGNMDKPAVYSTAGGTSENLRTPGQVGRLCNLGMLGLECFKAVSGYCPCKALKIPLSIYAKPDIPTGLRFSIVRTGCCRQSCGRNFCSCRMHWPPSTYLIRLRACRSRASGIGFQHSHSDSPRRGFTLSQLGHARRGS